MTTHQVRVEEARQYLVARDLSVGFRKLLNCAMDTQDMSVYSQAIQLTDWKEKNPQLVDEFIQKCLALLEQTAAIAVEEMSREGWVIQAQNIQKSYGNKQFLLGPVSIEIKKGEVYGLVGENGNGKTTLLRILAKELSYTSGNLQFRFSKPYESEFDLKTKLIYIPQRTERWYGSLKDNLKFVLSNYGVPPEENELRTLLMIARLGLWNYKHLKWDELSSGYKMRFELARTLLRKPEILLLDEPLANLDVLAQQIILEDLKEICDSTNNPIALILSSQQLYEVEKISDEVIFLKNGKYRSNVEQSDDHNAHLILEIDTQNSREDLLQLFGGLNLENMTYNGGVYIATFDKGTDFNEALRALGASQKEITYIRNISTSTRRFFVNS